MSISYEQLNFFFCFQWSAVYYTGGPKAESPLSQGPRPAFVKIFYTPCVCVQTHQPKSLEAYKGRVNTITITLSFTCYVFKQLIINKPVVTLQQILSGGRAENSVCFLLGNESLGCDLQDSSAQMGSYPSTVIPTGAKHRVQSQLERRPSTISTDRPEMESRPYEFLLHSPLLMLLVSITSIIY